MKNKLFKVLPLLIIGIMWEFTALEFPKIKFLFASPSSILKVFYENIINGNYFLHFCVTASEALVGLIIGFLFGSLIGFAMLYFTKFTNISKMYFLALSSIPVFAIAPMMIIWFGIGFSMKVAVVVFSTLFTSIFQAYEGGIKITKEDELIFINNKASYQAKFWKLIFPYSLNWLIQSLKINCGLAILGAFIGEFISSENGLGYLILRYSGLYDIPSVLATIICIILLSFLFNFGVSIIEKRRLKIIRYLTVPKLVRSF
ncbi:MAG: ABC transporter permease subunit [Sediminibacterium sp.]|nr:ABC transporter permease subunit [Sediminibacterium sp.]